MNGTTDTKGRVVRIGAGAGYSGDRIEPAAELAEKGDIDYLIFECLAERTIAIGQQARLAEASAAVTVANGGLFAARQLGDKLFNVSLTAIKIHAIDCKHV